MCSIRRGIRNVCILITDGASNEDEARTIPNAEAAKRRDIEIVSVGITDRIDLEEIAAISSDPQMINMVIITGNEALSSRVT